ncbi:MAG: pentapeptide repeat-containing protein [Deltaproteobacteria bacterium]|nr:pentapeptide repeat-containing protein [Deltaproteobacteria bacterium]
MARDGERDPAGARSDEDGLDAIDLPIVGRPAAPGGAAGPGAAPAAEDIEEALDAMLLGTGADLDFAEQTPTRPQAAPPAAAVRPASVVRAAPAPVDDAPTEIEDLMRVVLGDPAGETQTASAGAAPVPPVRAAAELPRVGEEEGDEEKTPVPAPRVAPAVSAAEFGPGDSVAGVQLIEAICVGERLAGWRGERGDKSSATVHVLRPGASARAREVFLRGAEKLRQLNAGGEIEGLVRVTKVVPEAGVYVTDLAAVGSMADLHTLQWDLGEQIEFVRRLCSTLGALHERGVFHGCIRPASVLLDEELHPVLCDALVIDPADRFGAGDTEGGGRAAFVAPEVAEGLAVDARSDVYCVGRLMYFVLLGEDPPVDDDEPVPRLGRLRKSPLGVVRIVRRATARDPQRRYQSMANLLGDLAQYANADLVGIKHPTELGGLAAGDEPTFDGPAPAPAAEPPRAAAVAAVSRRAARRAEQKQAKKKPKAEAAAASSAAPAGTGVGVAGALLLGAAVAYSFFTASGGLLALSVALVGAALFSVVVPAFGPRPLVARAGMALGFVIAVLWLGPTTFAAESGRTRRLSSGSLGQRAAMLRQLRAKGFTDFTGLDLSSSDLGGIDLTLVNFSRSKLLGTSFKGAKLMDASLRDAYVSGANFSEANLEGVDVSVAVGWADSICDNKTIMPSGWRCLTGHPRAVKSLSAEELEQLPPGQASGLAPAPLPR